MNMKIIVTFESEESKTNEGTSDVTQQSPKMSISCHHKIRSRGKSLISCHVVLPGKRKTQIP